MGYNNSNRGGGQNFRNNRAPLEYVHTKSTYQERVPDNKNGGESDRLSLTLDQDQALQLSNLLLKHAQDAKDGVRFVLYTNTKQNNETGEYFPSTSISVQPYIKKQQQNGNGNGGGQRQQGRSNGGGYQKQNQQAGRASAPAPTPNKGVKAEAKTGGDFKFKDFGPEPTDKSEDIPF